MLKAMEILVEAVWLDDNPQCRNSILTRAPAGGTKKLASSFQQGKLKNDSREEMQESAYH